MFGALVAETKLLVQYEFVQTKDDCAIIVAFQILRNRKRKFLVGKFRMNVRVSCWPPSLINYPG